MELSDKTAIVTGGGRGIGEGISRVLAREGANVVVMGRHVEEVEGVARSINESGGVAMPVVADVTDWPSLEAMARIVVQRHGGIDILVNNAGIEGPPRMLVDLSAEQWDEVLGVNLRGVFLCCKAVLPAMTARNGGRIINIGSIAGRRMTFFGSADYTVSKYGVEGLTQHLAWELADRQITVNSVLSGRRRHAADAGEHHPGLPRDGDEAAGAPGSHVHDGGDRRGGELPRERSRRDDYRAVNCGGWRDTHGLR